MFRIHFKKNSDQPCTYHLQSREKSKCGSLERNNLKIIRKLAMLVSNKYFFTLLRLCVTIDVE